MRFRPKPNDSLDLFGETYDVEPHPIATQYTYSAEAGRATIYRVRDHKNVSFALKVFKHEFRVKSLVASAQRLSKLADLDGMRAAERRIVLPDADIVKVFPELEYAMLIPWIAGRTWFDLLTRAPTSYMAQHQAIRSCAQFLKVMAGLEGRGCAHADISQGNVILYENGLDVQLVDLEDVYIPGVVAPASGYFGSPGYRHRSADAGVSTWCEQGDRYAAAVLAAEILILTNQALAALATDEGYFLGHDGDAQAVERYRQARRVLDAVTPTFSCLFEQAWHSDSLCACPTIRELHEAIREDAADCVQDCEPAQRAEFPWLVWSPLDVASARTGKPCIDPQCSAGTLPLSPTTTVASPPPPPPSAALASRSRAKWFGLATVFVTIILAIVLTAK